MSSPGQLKISDNLSQWLDLSWFYPEGFKKRSIAENRDYYTVVGEQLSYRFHKYPADVCLRDKFEHCQRELQLNRELAPDLYLGARLLKWVDDEPSWITQQTPFLESFSNEMFEADEIGLVLRTVSKDFILSERVRTGQIVPERIILKISRLLKDFYQRRRRDGIKNFLSNPGENVASLQTRYLEQLSKLEPRQENGDFYNVILAYAKGKLQAEFLRSRLLLRKRGEEGKLVEIHSGLRSECICIERLFQSGKEINIFGRYERQHGDVLEDIADLYVDLLALGERANAEVLKGEFLGEKEDEGYLFRLFVSLKCFQRADEEIRSKFCKNLNIRTLLSTGFLSLLNVKGPVVICAETNQLAYLPILSAFLDASEESEDVESDFISNYWVRQDQRFLRAMTHLEENLDRGANFVFADLIKTKEQKITLAHLVERHQGRLIFLHSEEEKSVLNDEIFGATEVISNGPVLSERWNISKKQVSIDQAWGLVADFLIQALGKK